MASERALLQSWKCTLWTETSHVVDERVVGTYQNSSSMSSQPAIGTDSKQKRGRRTRSCLVNRRPKRACSAYIHFTKDHRSVLKLSEPTLKPQDVMRRLGMDWKLLGTPARAKYERMAQSEKESVDAAAAMPPTESVDVAVAMPPTESVDAAAAMYQDTRLLS